MNTEHAAYSTQVYILTDTSFNIHSYTNTQSNSVITPSIVATKLQQRAYQSSSPAVCVYQNDTGNINLQTC